MTQSSLWQQAQHNLPFAELCNALYEREIAVLAHGDGLNAQQIQARLKSLSYYVSRTAYRILQAESPISFDVQNASWSHKQAGKLPVQEQSNQVIRKWYQGYAQTLGMVIPVMKQEDGVTRIFLDSLDRVDHDNHRVRSNCFGWFDYETGEVKDDQQAMFLKPTKKVMVAACCGHQWKNAVKANPVPLNLRELLLTCSINWKNLNRPLANRA